jgi:hypothetical protein
MDDPHFQSGDFTTKFLEEFLERQNGAGGARIANA